MNEFEVWGDKFVAVVSRYANFEYFSIPFQKKIFKYGQG